jgi:nitric oxide reductase subunit B
MSNQTQADQLSPWWRRAVIIVMIVGFSVLIYLTVNAYRTSPPIPAQVKSENGDVIFTSQDVQAGQAVFLKYGLMDNGTVWGHGAYLGPDFSAAYLHSLSLEAGGEMAQATFSKPLDQLTEAQKKMIEPAVAELLKTNRYDHATGILTFTQPEVLTYQQQLGYWSNYFSSPSTTAGLKTDLISDPEELRQLTSFFAWTAWVSVANRPDKPYSYTNNFPYDPSVGNVATTDAILWSALSLIALLGGTAIVLFAFGRWDFLGWRNEKGAAHYHETTVEVGTATPGQRSTIKLFVIVGLLMVAQMLAGALVAHYRADPASFYGLDLSGLMPSNLTRTWHLQMAIFWIATAFVAGALFLAPMLSGKEAKKQDVGIHVLFAALLLVVGGSLLGEWLGINNKLGNLWFWLGDQGWEYLEIGRIWQLLLAGGLLFWLFLVIRTVWGARQNPGRKEIVTLFLLAAAGIPIFYVPAMFFDSMTNYTVVDTWRFWIIHLWVEGFFELFATVMVAIIFFVTGIISKKTVLRVIYLDAILYLAGGVIGTGHHWYWTGQPDLTMALAATFSALEVVPLTLLTLDAWDFIKLTKGKCEVCGQELVSKHKWAFYFLMAVGFWNFLGAGVFGFLINTPIVSYFEAGTMLTPNHGHSAMMGVFGMLSMALLTFALRQVLKDEAWAKVEKFVKVGFWGLNAGLLGMVIFSLFPGGVLQLVDVLNNGYWHARSIEYMQQPLIRTVEWIRIGPDIVFGFVGVIPIAIAAVMTYFKMRKQKE